MDPTKLKYVVERAAQDEQLEQLERLQRGELTPEEAAALRASKAPDAEVLYELYRPLDDLEKQRLLRAAQKPARTGIAAVAVIASMAAVLGLVSVQWSAQVEPVEVLASAEPEKLVNGHHTLGSADAAARPVVHLDGCMAPVVMSPEREGRLKEGTQAMAFFQRAGEVVPWPIAFHYDAASGTLRAEESCSRLPSRGLSAGSWRLVIVHGSSLPSAQQAESVLRGAFRPPWARWKTQSTEVEVQPPLH